LIEIHILRSTYDDVERNVVVTVQREYPHGTKQTNVPFMKDPLLKVLGIGREILLWVKKECGAF
jgi:hypothetical protein